MSANLNALLSADLNAAMQSLDRPNAATSAVLSGLMSGCTRAGLPPATASATAWALWQHAVAVGLVLTGAAQKALWQTQSGDCSIEQKHLQHRLLMLHNKSGLTWPV